MASEELRENSWRRARRVSGNATRDKAWQRATLPDVLLRGLRCVLRGGGGRKTAGEHGEGEAGIANVVAGKWRRGVRGNNSLAGSDAIQMLQFMREPCGLHQRQQQKHPAHQAGNARNE